MNKVKVITKLPNEKAKITEMPNDYESVFDFVGGLIDSTFLPTDEDIDVIVNDSSLTLGMEPNIVTPEFEGFSLVLSSSVLTMRKGRWSLFLMSR